MKKYKIVYIYSNCGIAMFTILHKGECLYDSRRDVGFNMKSEKVGEEYEIVFKPEEKRLYSNPYCQIVKKIETDDSQRLKNLIDATSLIIENLYTTEEEQLRSVVFGNDYYVSGLYYQFVLQHFKAIIKFFSTLKFAKTSKKIKKIVDTYTNNNEFYMLNRPEDVISLKKNEYPFFVSKRKILKDLQSKLKTCSEITFEKIKQEIEMYKKMINVNE